MSPATRYSLLTHHREKLCIYNVINDIALHWDRPNPLIQTCPLLWSGPGTFRKSWTKSLMRSPTLGCVPLAAVAFFQTGTWFYMYIILTTGALKLRVAVTITYFWPKNLCFDTTRELMVYLWYTSEYCSRYCGLASKIKPTSPASLAFVGIWSFLWLQTDPTKTGVLNNIAYSSCLSCEKSQWQQKRTSTTNKIVGISVDRGNGLVCRRQVSS